MTDRDERVLHLALRKLFVAFRVSPDPELIEVYVDGLEPLGIRSILGACAKSVERSERFPTVAELVRLASDGTVGRSFLRDQDRLLGTPTPRAALPQHQTPPVDAPTPEEIRSMLSEALAKGVLKRMPGDGNTEAEDQRSRRRQLDALKGRK